jgi:hypothetical protein
MSAGSNTTSALETTTTVLRALAVLVSPTVIGVLIIFSVLTDAGISSQVRDSEVVSSVALVVGAALILGSIALYLRRPDEYDRYQLGNAEQLLAVVQQAQKLIQQRESGSATPDQATLTTGTQAPAGERAAGAQQ